MQRARQTTAKKAQQQQPVQRARSLRGYQSSGSVNEVEHSPAPDREVVTNTSAQSHRISRHDEYDLTDSPNAMETPKVSTKTRTKQRSNEKKKKKIKPKRPSTACMLVWRLVVALVFSAISLGLVVIATHLNDTNESTAQSSLPTSNGMPVAKYITETLEGKHEFPVVVVLASFVVGFMVGGIMKT